jgi:hypothetical protein
MSQGISVIGITNRKGFVVFLQRRFHGAVGESKLRLA